LISQTHQSNVRLSSYNQRSVLCGSVLPTSWFGWVWTTAEISLETQVSEATGC